MCSRNLRSEDPLSISQQVKAIVAAAPDAPDVEAEAAKIMEAAESGGILDGERALELAAQRAKGVLLPQLLGRTTFMDLELVYEPGVCVVREETELLGWTAVNRLRELQAVQGVPKRALHVVDLCTGSGNLSCGIAKAVPESLVWAIDIESASVELAQKNVVRHALSDRVDVLQGDLFGPLGGKGLEGSIDMVVCNPPYIASVRLQKDKAYLVANEPRAAFDGGPFGINIQLRLAKEAVTFLKPGGWLLFEFGLGQDRQVKQIMQRTECYDIMDFAYNQQGEARVSQNRKNGTD